MSDPPITTPLLPIELTDDLPCTRCGYNLRGLRQDARCPECFTPVSRSVHGNLLRFADPDWLDKLRLGAALMLWNIVAGFFVGLVAGVLVSMGIPHAVVQIVTLIGAGLGLWATVLVTTPEPTVAFVEDPITLRRFVRASAVCQALGAAAQSAAGSSSTTATVQIIGGLLSLVGLVAYVGMFVFLRRLAQRVPDAKLVKNTKIVMWGSSTSVVLLVVGGAVTTVTMGLQLGAVGGGTPAATAGPGGFTTGAAAGVGLVCVAGVGAVVFGLWYISLLVQYHKAFKTAAAQARTTLAGG